MRIGEGALTRLLRGLVLAPHLPEAQKETLFRRVSVDGGALAVQRVFHGHVGDAHPAVVSGVLAQRQLAVQLHVIHGGETGKLVGDTGRALFERGAVGRRPPFP